ncbi:MAG TPA: 2OG-Fe(II) oxygenase [Bryobacteraceae bacterium]|nr:2OG-Fe(II) oxygenase [Bryobacteraceae bacterium]
MINPLNPEALRRQIRSSAPFPHCLIDNFLSPEFAGQVHEAFPSFAQAQNMGRTFRSVNEKNKVQITDTGKFSGPILELVRLLAAPELLDTLSAAFEIPNLVADDRLTGGGIHQTGPRGRLDVHVDFNYLEDQQLFRRLNILVYFNREWPLEWGGNLELWDKDVKVCRQSFAPVFNRCIIIETGGSSYHGVSAVCCPDDRARRSFAAYYYTREAPPGWDGRRHSTLFRSRPNEKIKGSILMPLEQAGRRMREATWSVKRAVKTKLKNEP